MSRASAQPESERQMKRVAALFPAILVCVLGLWGRPAYAYRPFNSTDAAVATRGDIEIECGPFGYIVDADGRFLVIPTAIVNIGIADGWEIVIEGRNFLRVASIDRDRADTVRETALSVKHVLREGSLQERSGPSIAFESGLLLPGIGTDPGVGASLAGIVSQRWSAVTVHVNGELMLTREHAWGGFAGAIVEGPSKWLVRPVAEVTVEQDAGLTTSGLVGAIWQVHEHLSLDAGWRVVRSQGSNVREFRAGFTWAFPIGAGSDTRRTAPQPAVSRSRLGA